MNRYLKLYYTKAKEFHNDCEKFEKEFLFGEQKMKTTKGIYETILKGQNIGWLKRKYLKFKAKHSFNSFLRMLK